MTLMINDLDDNDCSYIYSKYLRYFHVLFKYYNHTIISMTVKQNNNDYFILDNIQPELNPKPF